MELVNWRVLLVGLVFVIAFLYFYNNDLTHIIMLNEWFLSATNRTPIEDTGW